MIWAGEGRGGVWGRALVTPRTVCLCDADRRWSRPREPLLQAEDGAVPRNSTRDWIS